MYNEIKLTTEFALRLSLGCINQLESTLFSSIMLEREIVVLEVLVTSLLVISRLLLIRRRHNKVGMATELVLLVEVSVWHIAKNLQLLASYRPPTVGVKVNI